MDHDVERERKADFGDEPRDVEFFAMRSHARDHLGAFARGALDAQLNMVEARLAKAPQLVLVEQSAAGDQVGIEICARACTISSTRSPRSTGSPPERCNCTTPSSAACEKTRRHSSVESSARERWKSTGIGAVHASQRASIGELRDERIWARRRAHWSNPRARIVARKSITSRVSASRSAPP